MTQISFRESVASSNVPDDFAANADQLILHNQHFAKRFEDGDLAVAPTMRLAVVACMDSRMDIFKILGLENGEAHIVRNAGGVITDDVIRSLCLSQRFLGTQEIILLHHTDCGLQMVSEDDFKAELEAELGVKPRWSLEPFADPYADTRQSMQRLLLTPFVDAQHLRGFVYDVTDGLLHEVSQAE
jgi:carbonic anhydrase|tara:strand:- start:153 stop:707 length:555 start_codon:yes stop_codon:yes gene_type:complete